MIDPPTEEKNDHKSIGIQKIYEPLEVKNIKHQKMTPMFFNLNTLKMFLEFKIEAFMINV